MQMFEEMLFVTNKNLGKESKLFWGNIFYKLSAYIMITVHGRNKYFDHNITWHHKHYIFSSIIRLSIDYRALACPTDLSVAIGLWRLTHLLTGRTCKFDFEWYEQFHISWQANMKSLRWFLLLKKKQKQKNP